MHSYANEPDFTFQISFNLEKLISTEVIKLKLPFFFRGWNTLECLMNIGLVEFEYQRVIKLCNQVRRIYKKVIFLHLCLIG